MMGALVALIFVSGSNAQPRREHDKVVPLDAEESRERWTEFATSHTVDYCMDFTITHYPRRGRETVFDGEIFAIERGNTALTRIRIKPRKAEGISDFIFKNSPKESKIWKLEDGKFRELGESEWFAPMVDGLIYSPFDLLLSYKFWTYSYAGPGRIGQAVHFFDLQAPHAVSDKVSKVRVALSREFNAPVQTETFNAKGEPAKTLSLGSVKKVDDVWIMLKAEVRDEATRDKDKLQFTAAKLNAEISPETFDVSDGSKMVEKPRLERL